MPGSGKSVVGKLLARKLGRTFIDVDRVIERRERLPLGEVLKKHGARGFLKVEERACLSIRARGAVVAPGGSVILEPAAVRHFKKTGVLVYLRVGLSELRRRLGDLRKRGVVPAKGGLKGIYDLRRPLYERHADVVVVNTRPFPTVRRILKGLPSPLRGVFPRKGPEGQPHLIPRSGKGREGG
jgi:shikimate kinase